MASRTSDSREDVRRAVIDGTIKGDWDKEQRELSIAIARQLLFESQQFFNSALADIERYARYISDAHGFFAHVLPPEERG